MDKITIEVEEVDIFNVSKGVTLHTEAILKTSEGFSKTFKVAPGMRTAFVCITLNRNIERGKRYNGKTKNLQVG